MMISFQNVSSPIDPFAQIAHAFAAGRCSQPLRLLNDDDEADNEEEDDFLPHQMWAHDLFLVNQEDFLASIDALKWSTRENVTSEDLKEKGQQLLFVGSQFKLKDLSRFCLFLKSSNASMGDRLFASVVGSMGTFLPRPNILHDALGECPSMYSTLKLIQSAADIPDDLSTFKIDTCANGCVPFMRDDQFVHRCPECLGMRWKHCRLHCLNEAGLKTCSHKCEPIRTLFYLSIRDRIVKLLLSDLHHLFHYEDYRHKCSNDDFVEDIFDSTTYHSFKRLVPQGHHIIFLQVSMSFTIICLHCPS